MVRETIGFLMIMLVVVVALLIWFSVRRRRAEQESQLAKPLEATSAGLYETFYVSTVFDDAPLDRVWAHGLAMRGKAKVAAEADGISVHRTGERGFLIPSKAVISLDTASATIDKGVEKNGLTVIRWSLGDIKVASHFRFTNPRTRKEFEEKVSQLMGAELG